MTSRRPDLRLIGVLIVVAVAVTLLIIGGVWGRALVGG